MNRAVALNESYDKKHPSMRYLAMYSACPGSEYEHLDQKKLPGTKTGAFDHKGVLGLFIQFDHSNEIQEIPLEYIEKIEDV